MKIRWRACCGEWHDLLALDRSLGYHYYARKIGLQSTISRQGSILIGQCRNSTKTFRAGYTAVVR